MIEVEALNFIETFPTYEEFHNQEKAILITKYSALVGATTDDDFESIYKDTYNFVMQTIYNYYDNYYLTSATKDRFLTLLGTIISGKLPAYKVKYDNYLNARNIVYDNLTTRDSSSASSGTEGSSGKQNYKNNKSGSRTSSGSSDTSGATKYADTPENIEAGIDFVDDYTTGQSKNSDKTTHNDSSSHSDTSTTETDFTNSRSKSGNKTYNETLKGGAKQLWENVQSIPSEIYKEVITITAKLFFSDSMEERNYPCAYLTLTAKVKQLEQKDITGFEQVLNEYDLVSTISTGEKDYVATTSLKIFKDIADAYYIENKGRIDTLTGRVDTAESNIESLKERVTRTEEDIEGLDTKVNSSVKEVGHTYDTSTRKLQLTYTLNNGTTATSTLTLPEVSLTASGLMTPTLFSKLDQVVLYGTNFVTTGRKFAVRKDEDNDLYVEVPESGSYTLPVASATTLGGIKVGDNLTITTDGVLSATGGGGSTYTLPPATTTTLGGVIVGDNLSVDSTGKINAEKEVQEVSRLYEYTGVQVVYDGDPYTITFKREAENEVINIFESLESDKVRSNIYYQPNIEYFKRVKRKSDFIVLSSNVYIAYFGDLTFEYDDTGKKCVITASSTSSSISLWVDNKQLMVTSITKIEIIVAENEKPICNITYTNMSGKVNATINFTALRWNESEYLYDQKVDYYTGGVALGGKAYDIEESGGSTYTLPVATPTTLGGIKVGENLSITSDGTLSATGGGSGVIKQITKLCDHLGCYCNNTNAPKSILSWYDESQRQIKIDLSPLKDSFKIYYDPNYKYFVTSTPNAGALFSGTYSQGITPVGTGFSGIKDYNVEISEDEIIITGSEGYFDYYKTEEDTSTSTFTAKNIYIIFNINDSSKQYALFNITSSSIYEGSFVYLRTLTNSIGYELVVYYKAHSGDYYLINDKVYVI